MWSNFSSSLWQGQFYYLHHWMVPENYAGYFSFRDVSSCGCIEYLCMEKTWRCILLVNLHECLCIVEWMDSDTHIKTHEMLWMQDISCEDVDTWGHAWLIQSDLWPTQSDLGPAVTWRVSILTVHYDLGPFIMWPWFLYANISSLWSQCDTGKYSALLFVHIS